jgi:hypothetical protein
MALRHGFRYVTAFVAPATRETVWYLSNGIDKAFFAELLAAFARAIGAGRERIIVLARSRPPRYPRRHPRLSAAAH